MHLDRVKLKVALARKDMSQKKLCEKTSLSVSTMWRICHGTSPHPTTLHIIAEALGVDPIELLVDG